MSATDLRENLKGCELFTSLDEGELDSLAALIHDACDMKQYPAGSFIFEQGGHSDRLYIIASGQVLLERSVNLGQRSATLPLGLLGRGRAMGWSSLLYGPRSMTSSALCQKPVVVVTLEGASFRQALEKNPAVGFKVMDRLACLLGERLRTAFHSIEAHL